MRLQLKQNRLNLRISGSEINWYCLFLLQAFPLVVPDGLFTISPFLYVVIYSYWQKLSFATVIVEFLYLSKQRKRVTALTAGILALFCYIGFLTFVQSGSLSTFFNNFSIMVFAVLLIDNKQYHLDRFACGLLMILKFWIYVNFMCMVLTPEGMYLAKANNSRLCWILGYKSSFQYYILPAICLSWLNMAYRGKKTQFYILCAICGYEAIFSKNTMLIIGLAVMLLVFLLRLFQYEKVFHVHNYMLAIGVVNVVYICFVHHVLSWGWVQLLLLFFGKNLTLSNRLSLIMPKTLEAIRENWMFGLGVLPTEKRVAMYGYLKGAIHAHNQIAEFLFIGGVILLVAYILLNLQLSNKLMKYRELESAKILALSVFILYFMMVVEVFTRSVGGPIWCVLFLAYYCNKLDAAMRQRRDSILSENH